MKTITIHRNGYFIINKKVYAEPLKYMPYSQAYIKRDENGDIYLYSYITCVACIKTNGAIECYGLYSNTTRKHISAFARQFGYNYYDFKNAFLRGIEK